MSVDTEIALTTLATIKDELGITDTSSDTYLERQINVISQKISNYCNRNFKSQTYTDEKYYGTDDIILNLNNYPVTDLTKFELDNKEIDLDDITIKSEEGQLYYEKIFNSNGYVSGISEHRDLKTENISITFEAGYILPDQEERNLPYDLEQACIDEIVYKYGNKGNKGKKVSSWGLDKASKSYESDEIVFNSKYGLLNETLALLDSKYKRYVI